MQRGTLFPEAPSPGPPHFLLMRRGLGVCPESSEPGGCVSPAAGGGPCGSAWDRPHTLRGRRLGLRRGMESRSLFAAEGWALSLLGVHWPGQCRPLVTGQSAPAEAPCTALCPPRLFPGLVSSHPPTREPPGPPPRSCERRARCPPRVLRPHVGPTPAYAVPWLLKCRSHGGLNSWGLGLCVMYYMCCCSFRLCGPSGRQWDRKPASLLELLA